MRSVVLTFLLAGAASAFVIPFRLAPAPVTNITTGGAPLAMDAADMIVIPNTDIGQALEVPASIASVDGVDGVLGLAFQSIADGHALPPIARGIQQGDIADSLFSIWLEELWQTSDNGTAGVIYYGGMRLCRDNIMTKYM
ncbi:unnamed protein product [Strongylus vulgaris]|uniref:Peptidase A1 domain-containing protein n=1 Tax=Strongylus vulgaris TaxID=40348 RepID=A0A3P7LFC1_STRVU|nr:unnamed protein product [Strongylus vulgaris]